MSEGAKRFVRSLSVVVVLVCAVAGTAASVWPDSLPRYGQSRFVDRAEHAAAELAMRRAFGPEGSGAAIDALRKERVAAYRESVDSFYGNLKLQCVIIVLSLLILFRRADGLKLPVLDIQVPAKWMHLIIPAGGLYVWFRFGFYLDDAIKGRLACWYLLPDHARCAGDPLSQASLLNDSGLLDGWFISFAPGLHNIDASSPLLVEALTAIVLGLVLGLSHACTLAVLVVGRMLPGWPDFFRRVFGSLPWVAASFLILTHLAFAFGGEHRNYAVFGVAFVAIVSLRLLLEYAAGAGVAAGGGASAIEDNQ